jgi:chitodextrinase
MTYYAPAGEQPFANWRQALFCFGQMTYYAPAGEQPFANWRQALFYFD